MCRGVEPSGTERQALELERVRDRMTEGRVVENAPERITRRKRLTKNQLELAETGEGVFAPVGHRRAVQPGVREPGARPREGGFGGVVGRNRRRVRPHGDERVAFEQVRGRGRGPRRVAGFDRDGFCREVPESEKKTLGHGWLELEAGRKLHENHPQLIPKLRNSVER